MIFYTIGVYGSSEQEFFQKLTNNNIDTFCDIRQRRGVRGAKYAFVNSTRLQTKLSELDIKYEHFINLAPTTEIRELQKLDDTTKGILKKDRSELGKIFTIEYKNKILNSFDFDSFLEKLDDIGALKVVLFCVEETPQACHRSLVADKLEKLGHEIIHI